MHPPSLSSMHTTHPLHSSTAMKCITSRILKEGRCLPASCCVQAQVEAEERGRAERAHAMAELAEAAEAVRRGERRVAELETKVGRQVLARQAGVPVPEEWALRARLKC